jgi:cytochrome c6
MVLRLVLFAGMVMLVFSCGNTAGPEGSMATSDVAKLYSIRCAMCHGDNGKLGLAGASDLSISQMTMEERIAIITNGKGTMTPFKDMISAAEINSLAEYIGTLRSN